MCVYSVVVGWWCWQLFLVHCSYWRIQDTNPLYTIPFKKRMGVCVSLSLHKQLTNLHTLTLKMEAACTSEMSATLPTTTQCHYPKTELISVTNHQQHLQVCVWMSIYIYKILRHFSYIKYNSQFTTYFCIACWVIHEDRTWAFATDGCCGEGYRISKN